MLILFSPIMGSGIEGNLMKRLRFLLVFCVALLLPACSPAAAGASTASPTAGVSPVIITIFANTAVVSTALPAITTPPPGATPPTAPIPAGPTPIPTLAGGLGPSELKYRLLAQFPDLFFCDPDFYPVARADEGGLAVQVFPALQANPEEFNAILTHNQLTGLTSFSDAQKLLIYREHKKLGALHFVLSGSSYQFSLQVSPSKGQGKLISGTIDGQGVVNVQQRKATVATCPVCLAEGTLIDTPAGSFSVQNLLPGMLVWTQTKGGGRVAEPVLRVGKTVVPASHQVVHLVLADGRKLWVSPGHPTADGRQVGTLRAGEALDGSIIRSADLVGYAGYATYDLLPGGETGFYWANGILMGSTLKGQ
jgi:hypothetical protein